MYLFAWVYAVPEKLPPSHAYHDAFMTGVSTKEWGQSVLLKDTVSPVRLEPTTSLFQIHHSTTIKATVLFQF